MIRSMLMTWGRDEAMSEDVTWRNVEVIDWKQMGPPALMTSNDILNDVKVDKFDILNILNDAKDIVTQKSIQSTYF